MKPKTLAKRWKEVRLGDILELSNGKSMTKKRMRRDGAIPVYGANGMIGRTDESPLIERDTVVIGRVGSSGAVTIVKGPCWISDNAMYVSELDATVDLAFLAYALGQMDLPALAKLAAQPSISQGPIKSQTIPLPPLPEQRRIVARIEELMTRIEEAKRLRKEASAAARQFLPSALTQVLSGAKIEGWTKHRLGDEGLCKVVPGQHIMSDQYGDNRGGTPYITGPADFGSKFPSINKWTLSPKVFAEPGDVLLTVKGAGVGKVNCAPDLRVSIGRQVMALRPDPRRMDRDYLYFCLRRNLNYFQTTAQSATVPGLRREHVGELKIPLPTVEKQRQISAYLNGIQAQANRLRRLQSETQKELDRMAESVLAEAFRGEL